MSSAPTSPEERPPPPGPDPAPTHAGEAEAGTATPPGATMFDLWGPARHRDAPALWRMIVESLRLAWAASPRDVMVIAAAQVVTVLTITAEVLILRSLLAGLLHSTSSNGSVGGLAPQIGALAALTALLGVTLAVEARSQRLLAELTSRRGEDRVLAVTGSVELAAFDQPGFHDRVARALLAVRLLSAVVNRMSGLVRALAGALGALIALLAIAPVFAPFVVLVFVPVWLGARRRGRVFHEFASSLTPRDRERGYLAELLTDRDAAKELRAYGLSDFIRQRHDRLWDHRIQELRTVADRQLRFTVMGDLAASVILCVTLLALVSATVSHDISVAGAGAAAAAIALLAQRVTAAASSTAGLSESALFMGDYKALTTSGTEEGCQRAAERTGAPADEAPGAQPQAAGEPGSEGPAPGAARSRVTRTPVRVEADRVRFAYPGARGDVLHDVSMEIEPGEVVALVGENGSGKTTMAKLLAGLYAPAAGRITWNGIEVSRREPAERAHDVAVIFQDFLRYALPARENIGVGRHELLGEDEAVVAAAQLSGAHPDLERLPGGYDTMLGSAFEGGTDLSLGQWQRVALARAIFRDAPFVILDEPAAALDAQAEHDLFAGIRRHLAGRSVLLISHRFASVREADRIHVMHAGAIAETGTHAQLMARGGRYARLFELQAAPFR